MTLLVDWAQIVARRPRGIQVAQSELNAVEHILQDRPIPEDVLVVVEARVEDATLLVTSDSAPREIFRFTPIRKKQAEWMIPDFEAISPYTPMPSLNASPELPTRANAVIVVPNTDINSMNGPIECRWLRYEIH